MTSALCREGRILPVEAATQVSPVQQCGALYGEEYSGHDCYGAEYFLVVSKSQKYVYLRYLCRIDPSPMRGIMGIDGGDADASAMRGLD